MKYIDKALDQRGERGERVKRRGANTKTMIASVGISFYKVVFPVTVLSIAVNISPQSKHMEGGGGGAERLDHSPAYCTSSLIAHML